jgi:osmotically-inducible protein OsmY
MLRSFEEEIASALEAARVEQAATSRLQRSAYAALKAVNCQYRRGTLLLKGDVPTYFHKQLAQEAMRALPGVSHIANRISVRQERCKKRELDERQDHQ